MIEPNPLPAETSAASPVSTLGPNGHPTTPPRDALMKALEAERAERLKKCGEIVAKAMADYECDYSVRPFAWIDGSGFLRFRFDVTMVPK